MQERKSIDQLALIAGHIVSHFSDKDDATMVALLEPIEDAAALQQAETRRAVLFQQSVLCADLSEIAGTTGWDPEALTQRAKRMEALATSVLNFLELTWKLDRDEIGGAYFARRGYVPLAWQDVATATTPQASADG